jgi:AcrR family transcriptional regulator
MLNMRSDDLGHAPDPDRTAAARIRDAAIARFAAAGVAATTVREIAADAGVSPALVIHHYGSKDALREACDQHVAATIRDRKLEAMAQGPGMDPLAALREAGQGPPLLRYLARTLVDGSPHVAALVDELVEDAVAYMDEGVASGLVRPSEHARERAIVVTMWSLGALVLHEHITRLAGIDLTGDAEDLVAWALPATEILTNGLLVEGFYERVRDALAAEQEGVS